MYKRDPFARYDQWKTTPPDEHIDWESAAEESEEKYQTLEAEVVRFALEDTEHGQVILSRVKQLRAKIKATERAPGDAPDGTFHVAPWVVLSVYELTIILNLIDPPGPVTSNPLTGD